MNSHFQWGILVLPTPDPSRFFKNSRTLPHREVTGRFSWTRISWAPPPLEPQLPICLVLLKGLSCDTQIWRSGSENLGPRCKVWCPPTTRSYARIIYSYSTRSRFESPEACFRPQLLELHSLTTTCTLPVQRKSRRPVDSELQSRRTKFTKP